MYYGIIDLLKLIGSLVLFLYGMKLMSESLQKVAGDRMRSILAAMTSNKFRGILTGFLITSIIQSSSATTVMLVSFVNAGLINLLQSIGVIMGANIGTTVTAWIISVLGFKVSMGELVLPLMGIALPLIFSKNRQRSNWGAVIIGFALIFIGLNFLQDSTPDVNGNPEILQFLSRYAEMGYGSVLIFLLVGTLLTVVIQSSSAVMALTLVMCSKGWLSFEVAAAMVLGENIGTTITANLAALIANTSAKRTARAHLIFNVFGVILILFFFYPFLNFVNWAAVELGFNSPLGKGGQTPQETADAVPIALSIYHTSFNMLLTFLLVWFVKHLAAIVTWMVPQKEDDEEFRLKYISTGMLSTNELSILQAQKESQVYAIRIRKMFDCTEELIQGSKTRKMDKLLQKIRKYEDISDRMEEEITSYLTRMGEASLSDAGSAQISRILYAINKIESIGDSCHMIARTVERQMDKKIQLTPEMNENFNNLFALCKYQLDAMAGYLDLDGQGVPFEEVRQNHQKLEKMISKFQAEHFKNLKKGLYKCKDGIIYTDIYSELGNIANLAFEINSQLQGAALVQEAVS
ncbi:MAG: Na/Pi cotransporter family protein [Bacteroidales bacterium]|nr:Na/Pi cotransporter family protein [Bacteroidales bacterium]